MNKSYFIILLKIFVFVIFITKTNIFAVSAFVGEDLGLDLYKKIDSGVDNLYSKQYSYELKGGIEGGTIAEKVNRILKSKGLGYCKIKDNITEDDINNIADGDLKLLSSKIENNKCSEDKGIINNLQLNIYFLREELQEKAKNKTEQIQKISKIGLYSDGNTQNSPFDIIADIKKIDEIVFTQKIDYEGEINIGDNELDNYLKGKLKKLENKINKKLNDGLDPLNQLTEELINGEKNKDKNSEKQDTDLNKDSSHIIIDGDNTSYACPNTEDSGLDESEINNILSDLNNGTSNNLAGIINKKYKPYNPGSFGFATKGYGFGTGSYGSGNLNINGNYQGVNDNESWKCDTFFCIVIEFITHNQKILGGSNSTMSLEALVDRSNGHLKTFANGSLIQSKMTTNNFELGLRDLDVSDIFSFGMVITKKSPPMLDLEGLNEEKNKDKKNDEENDPFAYKNLLRERLKANGIKYERENDLSSYIDTIGKEESTFKTAELNFTRAGKNAKDREKNIKEITKLDLHMENVINSESNANDTDDLYKEFLELERFTAELQAYINDFDQILDGMLKIPIHP